LTWLQIRSIASYSLNLSGFNVLNYFNRNADNAIVGRYLGATPLGYYQLAYNIMLYAVQNLTAVIGRALFPAFTKVQDDNVRFRNAYVKGVSMIAAITFPLMAALMGTATPLVQVAFGPKWHPVAQLLVILAPVGLIQSVVSNVGQIYFAKGRTDWMLRWGLLSAVVVIPSFFLGLNWGISGIAWAYLIANVLLLYPALAIPFHLIELRMNTFLKPLLPILGCSLLMLCVLLLITPQIQAWKAPDQLVTLICAGMATYSVALLVIRPAAAMHFLSLKKASRKVVREAS
jgi:PST family polysaccharide transporter